MATLLRAPTAFAPQLKKPILPIELGQRSNALLAGVLTTPPGAQLYASAPPPKKPVTIDQIQRSIALLNSAIFTLPQAVQWYNSAPAPVKYLMDSQEPRTLALITGAPPPTAPPGIQLFTSAPVYKRWINTDFQAGLYDDSNPATPAGLQIFDSAPRRKIQVFIETLYRPLTLGINPNAAINQLSDSATPRKRDAYNLSVPNLMENTLAPPVSGPNLPLSAIDLCDSAPTRRQPAYFEIPQNILVRQPVPKIGSLIESAPAPSLKRAWVSEPQNLFGPFPPPAPPTPPADPIFTTTAPQVTDIVGHLYVRGTGTRVNTTAGIASTAQIAIPVGGNGCVIIRTTELIAIVFGANGVAPAAVDTTSILLAVGEFVYRLRPNDAFFRVIRGGANDAAVQLESLITP